MREGHGIEPSELQPDLPKWFQEHEAGHYQEVLAEELEKITTDPENYFGADLESKGLSRNEVAELARKAAELVKTDFSFDTVGARISELINELGQTSENIEQDAKNYVRELISRVQRTVLRRMIKEYLPRRKAIVHRGNFQEYSDQAQMVVPRSLLERISKLGPAGNILKFLVKDNSFHIEETREHLERGIGGFEFDVKTRGLADDEPVVTHAHIPAGRKKAPSLDEVLAMVRELLPEDPQGERSARRGLKLIMHLKVMEDGPEALQRILETVDKYNLGNQVFVQTGRPELIYKLDDLERQLSQTNPGRKPLRYLFQALTVPESSRVGKWVARKVHKGGEASGELRSMLNMPDNISPVEQWPPKGRTLEILQRHKSLLWVPAARYSRDLLPKAQEAGLGLSIGAFDRAEQTEEMLAADEEGRSPHSIVSLKKDMVYPKDLEGKEAE